MIWLSSFFPMRGGVIMSDIEFKFVGFNPDEQFRDLIKSMAENLHLSSPSKSGMRWVIEKGKGAVHASCRIASQAGTFVAETFSENPVHAIRHVEEKIKQQLTQWREVRFRSEVSSAMFDDHIAS